MNGIEIVKEHLAAVIGQIQYTNEEWYKGQRSILCDVLINMGMSEDELNSFIDSLNMNQEQAKLALAQGHKITHPYFLDDEYMYMEDGKLLYEIGVWASEDTFWKTRVNWPSEWRIFDPQSTITE